MNLMPLALISLATLATLVPVVAAGATFDVRDFGAKGDGRTKDTEAIQRALDACGKTGGQVRVPAGRYLTGSLFLGNGTDLHLERGAVILGSGDLADYNRADAYPQNYGSKSEGWSASHLIIAVERQNVSVTGEGVIDGNARAFMQDGPAVYGYLSWTEGFLESKDHAAQARPGPEIVFVECRDVRVEDVTLRDMACWSCFFFGCEGVSVRNVTVRNDRRYANTDGFDIDACRDVVVTGCDVETGDDAFAIRCDQECLKNKMRVCENVLVSNCVCAVSCNGVRVGVGRGSVRNLRICGLRVNRAANGLQLQSTYLKNGGLSISGVSAEDVTVSNALRGVVIGGQTDVSGIPLEDIRFRRIAIDAPRPIEVKGQGKTRPAHVAFDDVKITGAEYPFLVRDADDVVFSDVKFGWSRFAAEPRGRLERSGAYVATDTRREPYDAMRYPETRPVLSPEGDFGALRQWMDARSDRSDAAAFDHFLQRYYGTGWRYLRHYLRELYAQEVNRFKSIWQIGSRNPEVAPRLPDTFRQRAAELWREALNVALTADRDEPAFAGHIRRSVPAGLALGGFSVKVSDRPSGAEKTAAADLENLLGERLGGNPLTVDGRADVVFHVGDTGFARTKGLSSSDLADEQWVIRSFGGDVVVNGGGPRGCQYAVSHFLEDFCGVRFWTDRETDVPAASALDLGRMNVSGRPCFWYRSINRSARSAEASPTLAIRRRLNDNGEVPVPDSLGGSRGYGPPALAHTANHYVPWEKYGKEHPEWFSLREGRRVGGHFGGQLCLSNPELRRFFAGRVLENVEKTVTDARKNGKTPPVFYEVSINDNWNVCQCPDCKESCGRLNPSGQFLSFVNEVAAAVAVKYPEVMVTTLAYYYCEPAPKGVRAADNVVVKLCDTRTNQASSILDPENAPFREFLADWRACAKNIFVWDYAITYDERTESYPYPSEYLYADLYRYYATNGVKGVFWEQEKEPVADMHALKFYLGTKLFQDPWQDARKLLSDFYCGYYGAAARPVAEARRRLRDACRLRKGYVNWFPCPRSFCFLERDDMRFMREAFDRAERAVSADEKRLGRVRRARLGFDALERRLSAEPEQKNGSFLFGAKTLDIRAPTQISLVDDAESPDGQSVQVDADANHEGLFYPPIRWGVYDDVSRKTLREGGIDFATDGRYHWYDLGQIELPRSSTLYFTRACSVQLSPLLSESFGRTFAARVLLRVRGPKYNPTDVGTNVMNFAAVELKCIGSVKP